MNDHTPTAEGVADLLYLVSVHAGSRVVSPDSCGHCQVATFNALTAAEAKGAALERARIVAWLRSRLSGSYTASAIERGDHLKGE